MSRIGEHARLTFQQVEEAGPPCRPLDYPAPDVKRGVRTNTQVIVNPSTGQQRSLPGVIHRAPTPDGQMPEMAYYPVRQLQDAIYGSVWSCLVLRPSRHHQPKSNGGRDQPPGTEYTQMVWEMTRNYVAIKMVEWSRVQRLRGRHIEDPIKEVAAMQLIGNGSRHVLGSMEVLQDDNYLYSVMRFCRGGDLFGVVVSYAEHHEGGDGEEARMPEPMIRFWFRQILKGLHYLQSKGVCHRDLSLENILVDGQDCLIIDMGMCLREPYNHVDNPDVVTDVRDGSLRRLMKPQGVCGKHNYMSPEVFQNTDAFDGFAIDLWAAAVILYIMLTGFPPYDQASLVDERFRLIVTGHLTDQLNAWEVTISDAAGDLLQRMLQLDPRRRLTLAQVMCHPWVTNSDVLAPPPIGQEGWRQS